MPYEKFKLFTIINSRNIVREDMAEIKEDSKAIEEVKKPSFFSRGLGASGTLITSFVHQDEYLSVLKGTLGQKEFFKMSYNNSQVRKLIHTVNNPIKSAEWSISPFSDDEKDVKAAQLIEQILFKDFEDGWSGKLDEILTFPWHGHSIFEVIHDNKFNKALGYYTGLKNLAFRDQRTIDQWHYKDGILEKVQQLTEGDVVAEKGSQVFIPAKNLIIFYNEKRGNDAGFAFLRMIYGNYQRVNLYKTLQAIGIERGALGVPKLSFPEGVDLEDDNAEASMQQLRLYTQGENAFFAIPAGYELEIDHNSGFDPSRVQTAVKAENEEIAGSVVAMFLEMGIGGNAAVGSSTSESISFFKAGIEYLADRVKDKINLSLIPSLCRLNFGDELEGFPSLMHHGISDEAGEELMKVVTGYVKDGVIQKDDALEDHIRKSHNLPKKVEGEEVEQGGTEEVQPKEEKPVLPEVEEEEEEVELSSKKKKETPKDLMKVQAKKVSDEIRNAMDFAAQKYAVDVMNRYEQLTANKKQTATSKVKISQIGNLRKSLKRSLSQTAVLAISQARKEVPSKKDVELSNTEEDMVRMVDKFGEDVKEIKLNENSKLPSYIQVLIAKQSELISEDSILELKKRMDFAFSGIERKTKDPDIIKQRMEDEANDYIGSNSVSIKGDNSVSLVVNEGRSAFFFEDDVLEEIHSFTFMNAAPVSAVCVELAGVTFNNNDASSLRFTPPLHHNCKSYLRANLKTSKGVDKLEIQPLAPSPKAMKSINL